MPFAFVESEPSETDPLQAETALLDVAAQGGQAAQVWEAPASLVVPRSYLKYPGFETARTAFARRGCPVWLRMSGGGLVPQGPGILNLSLAYSVTRPPGELSEAVYLHLCEVVGRALRTLGIATHLQAVDGSFCDGRFNLACRRAEQPCKIAGTAQYWRRAPATLQLGESQRHFVLAHAVLLVSVDREEINQRANDFEMQVGSGRRYDAEKLITVQEALRESMAVGDTSLMSLVSHALKDCLGAIAPPTSLAGAMP